MTKQEKYTGVCAIQDKCSDYSDFVESIMEEVDNDDDIPCPIKCDHRVNPNPTRQSTEHKFTSTELLLLAHDEWKRREERKRIHEELAWVAGFLNGFCTDKKWAREYVDKLLQAGRE
jgi:hypothetical protein